MNSLHWLVFDMWTFVKGFYEFSMRQEMFCIYIFHTFLSINFTGSLRTIIVYFTNTIFLLARHWFNKKWIKVT